jgi:A/G-specific adenine glycosylase
MSKIKIQRKLLIWFKKNKRSLPWRHQQHWYFIWVAEVMLQQTQVEQAIPYYLKFVNRYGTVKRLAEASEQEVLKSWEGLGYYSRARHLHQAAQIIVKHYNAELPTSRQELLKLPGFGPYTANAVLSIAFNLPYGVVDGNIKRVISRLFLITDDINRSKTQAQIQAIMSHLLPAHASRSFNEAMMELGALICLPKVPICKDCPISTHCQALNNGMIKHIPFKAKKEKIPHVTSKAFVIKYRNNYLVVQRPRGEMLAGMWEFPIVKLNNGEQLEKLNALYLKKHFNLEVSFKKTWSAIKHSYTHFHLTLYSNLFITESPDFKSKFYKKYQWMDLEMIKELPLHRAMWKLLQQIDPELEIIPK